MIQKHLKLSPLCYEMDIMNFEEKLHSGVTISRFTTARELYLFVVSYLSSWSFIRISNNMCFLTHPGHLFCGAKVVCGIHENDCVFIGSSKCRGI